MIALIKITKEGIDIIQPIPEWIDPIAFSVFDCYGYALCENYEQIEEPTATDFDFSAREIENPYKQSEEDPETVTQRIATMKHRVIA